MKSKKAQAGVQQAKRALGNTDNVNNQRIIGDALLNDISRDYYKQNKKDNGHVPSSPRHK